MTLSVADRVLETSTTMGTGTLNLAGPVTGFRRFVSGVASGANVPYVIDDGSDWEIGIGVITDATPDTLARTTVIASSNSNALVDWGPGTRNVRLSPLAALVMQRDEKLNDTVGYGVGGGTANVQTVTIVPAPLAYSVGMKIIYNPTVANTSAFTINVNGLGAKNVKLLDGTNPAANAVLTTGIYFLVYDGTNLVLLNAATATAGALLYAADTGAADAYAIAPSPAIAAYVAGNTFLLKPANVNTGTSTLAVNGLSAMTLKTPQGKNLPPRSLLTTGIYIVCYDGTNGIVLNLSTYLQSPDIASAATLDLDTTNGDYVHVTGTTTITAITLAQGKECTTVFDGILTLTNGASLLLDTSANIITAAGDKAVWRGEAGGIVRLISYSRKDGSSLRGAPGTIIDRGYDQYTTNATLSTAIPVDNSIPQRTEGTEILSVTITPKSATSRIRIRFLGFGGGAAALDLAAALFVDSVNNALQATAITCAASGNIYGLSLEYEYVPGDTSAHTYKIRVGAGSSSMRMNGTGAGQLFGGIAKSTLVVEEIGV